MAPKRWTTHGGHKGAAAEMWARSSTVVEVSLSKRIRGTLFDLFMICATIVQRSAVFIVAVVSIIITGSAFFWLLKLSVCQAPGVSWSLECNVGLSSMPSVGLLYSTAQRVSCYHRGRPSSAYSQLDARHYSSS